jgi:hypothetical protein
MAAATVWWASTDWFEFGTTGISYDFSTGTLSGRVTGDGKDLSGSFLLTASFFCQWQIFHRPDVRSVQRRARICQETPM